MRVPSMSRLRRIRVQTQHKFEEEDLLRIIIKINNRTIYNVQATRRVAKVDNGISDYNVGETIRGITFVSGKHTRADGALVLVCKLLKVLIDKEERYK